MSARRFKESETGVDEFIDSQENNSKGSLTNKLERRRRIEELDEEKRLREELNEY